jgi:zinc transport system substrate-binding protein
MGDVGQPVLLLEKGADEHDFQLRPSQMRSISQADLVVWIGPELTPWLTRALEGTATTQQLALLDAPGTKTLPYEDPDHPKDAAAATKDADAHDEHDEHDHGAVDPHAWLDPTNALIWTDLIAAKLSAIDPENAATYQQNAQSTKAELTQLDAEITQTLNPIKGLPFVTFHAAYGYFTNHYALEFAGSVTMGDATSPGAEHLQSLQEKLRADGAICAFPEMQHDQALLDLVLDGTRVRKGASIDPTGSGADVTAKAYQTVLRNLAQSLSECLKG